MNNRGTLASRVFLLLAITREHFAYFHAETAAFVFHAGGLKRAFAFADRCSFGLKIIHWTAKEASLKTYNGMEIQCWMIDHLSRICFERTVFPPRGPITLTRIRIISKAYRGPCAVKGVYEILTQPVGEYSDKFEDSSSMSCPKFVNFKSVACFFFTSCRLDSSCFKFRKYLICPRQTIGDKLSKG